MVKGASPGPDPASQARASSSRLTRSSCRTWPQRKLRRNVPRVEEALTVQPSTRPVLPERRASSSMQSPPAKAEATRGHYLVAGVGPAWRIVQVQMLLYQLGKTEVPGQGGGQQQPSIVHQAVIVEGDLDAVEVVA